MTLNKKGLQTYKRAIPRALDAAAKETAEQAKEIRDGLVPIDTGDLLASGETLAGPRLGHWIMREGAGLPDARAAYTEYGTARQIAQPHFIPAVERARGLLRANVAKRIRGIKP